MKDIVARKVASWWADHLRNGAPLDNGDDSETGGMTMMLGKMTQAQTSFEEEAIQKFEDALVDILLHGGKYGEVSYLGVDCHPCGDLQDAGAVAGISFGSTDLPWKTSMWIKDENVTFSLGYQGKSQEL